MLSSPRLLQGPLLLLPCPPCRPPCHLYLWPPISRLLKHARNQPGAKTPTRRETMNCRERESNVEAGAHTPALLRFSRASRHPPRLPTRALGRLTGRHTPGKSQKSCPCSYTSKYIRAFGLLARRRCSHLSLEGFPSPAVVLAVLAAAAAGTTLHRRGRLGARGGRSGAHERRDGTYRSRGADEGST